jgi:hypothetical protein
MSPIDICNMALAHLGDRRITRIDDDAALADALVRYCNEFYTQARQEALAAHRWTFAKNAVALSQRSGSAIVIGYSYSHGLPEDMLRLMRLVPGTEVTTDGVVTGMDYPDKGIDKFKIVGKEVWSNTQFLALEYVKDVTDPDEWTPHFRAAVARLLASYLAGPTTDDPNEVAKQTRIYETIALPNAQFYDSVQDNSGENSDHQIRLAGSLSLQSRHDLAYGQTDYSDPVY